MIESLEDELTVASKETSNTEILAVDKEENFDEANTE